MPRKPRTLYTLDDPALVAAIKKRPRHITISITDADDINTWVRVHRPKISNLLGDPCIVGTVMLHDGEIEVNLQLPESGLTPGTPVDMR